jgi:integrating conjugative element protein (TIGR03752 family)
VQNRLMTALVGRIPVKGVVTDPYPFKIVFADDTLAANGLRVPNLRQMIVSGYTEGDLNLVSVRGWVTSLTFVFIDGTISTTTSNDNNIGRYTKENALGYLSDATGNPFIRGKLITNAPAYVGINVALGAAQGAANAFAQSQTTSNIGSAGNTTSAVTGSVGAFVGGQSASQAMGQVQQWWHDREENSFDAVYVPTVDAKTNKSQTVVVNFAKEIHIDYDFTGRKIVYVEKNNTGRTATLD